MRIIAGSARGMKLSSPKGMDTRPTPDMVREALFNILSGRVAGAGVLDLFAGTGAVGLEALSRGAEFAVFADARLECREVIRANAEKTGLAGRCRISGVDAFKTLTLCSNEGLAFDIVYLDPPYGKGLELRALADIGKLALLRADGLVIIERGGEALGQASDLPNETYDIKTRRYGGTELIFLQRIV